MGKRQGKHVEPASYRPHSLDAAFPCLVSAFSDLRGPCWPQPLLKSLWHVARQPFPSLVRAISTLLCLNGQTLLCTMRTHGLGGLCWSHGNCC